ncbi:MAG TPA: glycosyltransferase [Gemmataceae bacterium]|nr:glycosyltransferase [Gemmataceae bacterium]
MSPPPARGDELVVQVVGPADDWVLERLARRLSAKLPYAEFVPWEARPGGAVRIAYYVNYALYRGPSGLIDGAFFTHRDDAHGFLDRARQVDFCVCMCRLYADGLRAQGIRDVTHVPMGFDACRYRPQLVLGVVGKLDHPRKGRHLVERLRRLPFVEVVVSGGDVPEERLPELYQRVDYVLVVATVEGGPMSLLEGLAMGKPVIAPEGVGMVPEFGDTEHVRRYPAGDGDALVRLVTACYEEKLRPRRLVQERTWDRWAEGHHAIFMRLLRDRGLPVPEPAPGFRFGLLGEVEVPPGVEAGPLEAAVDRAAAHLYYGRYDPARAALAAVLPQYPCARRLFDTIPGGTAATDSRCPEPAKAHLEPLR